MRGNPRLWPYSAALALLAAVPAWGQFTYTSDFNSVSPGSKPTGWVTQNNTNPAFDPVILDQDPAGWQNGNCGIRWWDPNQVCTVDYTASGKRLTLLHPGNGSEFVANLAASAWYIGSGDAGYPMDLQSQSMKAEFDLYIRSGRRFVNIAGEGMTFVVQPVTSASEAQLAARSYGAAYGDMGWQTGGFAIEFDNWAYLAPEGSPVNPTEPAPTECDTTWPTNANHIGVDLFPYWDVAARTVTSVQTDLDVLDLVNGPFYWPCTASPDVLPYFYVVGDANVPVHITVYYNDPAHGGLGRVQVYMKIEGDATPWGWNVLVGGFGTAAGDPPEGKKILDYHVGPWPTSGAIFGFTGSFGDWYVSEVAQVTNVHVTTSAVTGTATPFTPTIPQLDAGATVNLTASAVSGTPTQPGWEVKTYDGLTRVYTLEAAKHIMAADDLTNKHIVASVQDEPTVDYVDTGSNGNVARGRPFPGLPARTDHDSFAMRAKGWIQFPAAGDYSLGLGADDGAEVAIGGQVILSGYTAMNGGSSTDLHCNLHVATAGVYPIQITYFAVSGGDGVEFYRRLTNITNPMTYPYVAIGSTDQGIAGQPVVYQLLNGNHAPDPALTPFSVTLSPSEKITGGSATGPAGFTIKTTPAPMAYHQYYGLMPDMNWDRDRVLEQWHTVALMMLDFLGNDTAHTGTSPTVSFLTGSQTGWPRWFTNSNPFPNLPAGGEHFGMRAEGFVTLAPGTYYLGMDANDMAILRIGNQTIQTCNYDTGAPLFALVVPPDGAGTYPIRIDYIQGLDTGYVDFYQLVDGNLVLVNDSGSTLTVHQSVTAGTTYHAKNNGYTIPASAKRGDTGTGANLGWNTAFVTATTDLPWAGYSDAILENDRFGVPCPWFGTKDTSQQPTLLAYGYSGNGRFPAKQTNWSAFPNSPGTPPNHFVLLADGFIDFPVAGDYGFNVCNSGMCRVWVGGELVQSNAVWYYAPYIYGDWPQDAIATSVHVDAPGLYEIRVEFAQDQAAGTLAEPLLEVFQFLPDATPVLLNDAGALQVYRNTAASGTPTDIIRLPAGTKVGPYDGGVTPGLQCDVVAYTPADGDVSAGFGHEVLWNLFQAKDLLDAVVDNNPDAKLRQQGTSLFSGPVTTVKFGNCWAGGNGDPFPGGAGDWFAVRLRGRIALKRGGTTISIWADDGTTVKIGGQVIYQTGSITNAWELWPLFYVYAEEDGLYPIEIDYLNLWGDRSLWLTAERTSDGAWAPIDPTVETSAGVKFYADVATCSHHPFADSDDDGDVDQDDFGAFQACYTGSTSAVAPVGNCKCFDRENNGVGNGVIDAADMNEFMHCWTGPAVLWSTVQPQGCNP